MKNDEQDRRSLEATHDEFSGEGEGMPADGGYRAYGARKSIDEELLEMVKLLAIPSFSMDRLSVRRVLGANRTEFCFDFSPSDIPIIHRVRKTCGAGDYEVWVLKEKKAFHKRLKLSVSQEEAERARAGGRVGAFVADGSGKGRKGRRRRGAKREGGVDEMKAKIAGLEEKISSLQDVGASPVDSSTVITHRDIIAAEERGYKRAKEGFDFQLATVKESHDMQIKMVRESKGIVTDSGIDDDSIIGQITSAIEAAKEAGGPIIDAYAYKMQGETDIRKARAGLYGDEFESEEGEPEEDGYEMTGDDVARLTNTMTELTIGAVSGGDAKKHADKILSEYEGGFAKWVFLSEGALDSYFAQRPDMIGKRPWFESVLDHMKSGIEKAEEKERGEKDEESTKKDEKDKA